MRLDKFLKVSGLVKRRSSAVSMIRDKRVYLNGREVKPSREVKEGDIIKLLFPYGVKNFRITEIGNRDKYVRVEEC